MAWIHNPILRGFNPDPSIVRVGEDYFIATSTFEWFPGVQIHHSRDLVHWRLLTHPLTRTSQLDMAGNPPSAGIWAPCLSHDGQRFHLIYTDVKSMPATFIDAHNYLVTAESIEGPWSEPVALNSSGFDPSLFHDDDGRKWLVNMLWDHRTGQNRFAGIVLQEYSPGEGRLTGPVTNIFRGTALGATEGPHLYKRNGVYYLMVAEGGTGYGHAVTVARSSALGGPYEADPAGPMLTSRANPDLPLQKAGHASLVETADGRWYLVHLTGRPIMPFRRCPLGRETAIQEVAWTPDGWLRMAGGGHEPALTVPAPDLPAHLFKEEPPRDDFDHDVLSVHFSTLRVPADESWLSLTERPGYLRLRGRESLNSTFRQSLVARRVQALDFTAMAAVQFQPEHFQQMAGLVCLYDVENWYYLQISRDEQVGRCLNLLRSLNGRYDEPVTRVELPEQGAVHLRAAVSGATLRFAWSLDGRTWTTEGPPLDFTALSDEACRVGRFTGAFVGVCCQDLAGTRREADFDYFEYRESE
ncbi:MAG: glycoside hydrolase family 43 protein [Planctomycetes bacterium]|nr:glycoside hydrolase family 43 protein [Planctomycetota bacterium]